MCNIYRMEEVSKEDEMVLRKIIGENPLSEDRYKKICIRCSHMKQSTKLIQ